MPSKSNIFTVRETHGMLRLPGVKVSASSDDRGWSSLYASEQLEIPFEQRFDAVDDQLIVLHLDGPITVHRRVQKGESSRLIPPGGMFMMPGGMDFSVRVDGTLRSLHLYLRRGVLEEVAGDLVAGDPAHVEILPRFGDNDPLIERLMLGVRDVLNDDNPSTTVYVDYLARAIVARLILRHSSASLARSSAGISTQKGTRQISNAIDFMQANLEHSLDLPTIAEATGLSASYFARQFRATVGKAPHQYLIQIRIDRAKRLLNETDSGIAEIAFACGFANQEHLTRLFKRSCGLTPAAYRKIRRD
jgi:AraC family transcriptional regulator